jgi:hypothetical protein
MGEKYLIRSGSNDHPVDPSTATDDNNNANDDNKLTKFNVANLVGYLVNATVTFGATGLLNRPSNGELSLKYQTLVTPAGWAFSIWGIIFTLQLVWASVPLFRKSQRNTPWIRAVGYNYLYVCVAQSLWTVTFSYESILLSVLCMYAILWFLWRAVDQLLPLAVDMTVGQYTANVAPLSIHLAWILAASFVNLNVLLVSQGVSDTVLFSAAVASLVLLFGTALYYLRWDSCIPTVLAWPLWAIYVELSSPAESILATFSTSQVNFVRYASIAASIILVLVVVVRRVLLLFGGRYTDSTSATYLQAP